MPNALAASVSASNSPSSTSPVSHAGSDCCTGRPEDSGIALQTVRELGPDFPIFGVCMGHQCIGQVFGGDVVRAPSGVMHGKTSPVHHNGTGLLKVRPLSVRQMSTSSGLSSQSCASEDS